MRNDFGLVRIAVAICGFSAVLLPPGVFAAGNNWMAGIGGNLRLSQISIPGTHDSGARFEPFPGTAKCQNATLAEQLNFGVRLLDIRCRHVNNAFDIYHGSVDQNMTFTAVLDQVIGFLTTNPGECVIMAVKEEHTSSGATRSFEATFDAYVASNPGRWSLGTSVPVLSGVRGKIVLLRRFGATVSKGINATNWPDNTSFNVNNLKVQDQYSVSSTATKWSQVTTALSSAFAETNANILHLNFTSGYTSGLFGIPSITTVSNYINPRVADYFGAAPRGNYGCVVMDFADANRSQLIYNTNFNFPPSFTGPIHAGSTPATMAFAGNIASQASDPNIGESLVFSKISGPAWLGVAANGALSGTPGVVNGGSNEFVVGVTDGGGLLAQTSLTITVTLTPIQEWLFQRFGSDADKPAIAGDHSDPDGDGLFNLTEYALGSDPNTSNVSGIVCDMKPVGDMEYLRMTVIRNSAATEVECHVLVTGDPSEGDDWTTEGTVIEEDTPTRLIVRDAIGGPRRFMRLRIRRLP